MSGAPWIHFLLEALAYTVGFRLYVVLRRRRGDAIAEPDRWSVIAAAAVGAALGSKILYWLDQPSITLAHRGDPAFLTGGKTIVGGLLGGLLAVEWIKARVGITRSTGDLFVLPLCLGMAVGRLGCFAAGLADHTYGTATTLPWGVDFGDGVRRHPTPLYEILMLGLIALWAWRRRDVPTRAGDTFRGFMILYLAFRLAVEWIKPELHEYLGLSGIQVACALALAYYARDVRRVFGTHSGEEADDGGTRPAVPVL